MNCHAWPAVPLRLLAVLVLGLLAGGPADARAEASPDAPTTLAGLRWALSNHLSQPRFAGALWGVQVKSLATGRTLFEHNAGKLFSPASNCKLFTVAAALDRLGADYRLRTSLFATRPPAKSGVLKGDLIVFGRGDPGFRMAAPGGDLLAALDPLVTALTNAGVRRIGGDLVADESFFRGPQYGSGWVWEDLAHWYGAAVSALTLDDNCFTLAIRPGAALGAPCEVQLSRPPPGVFLANLSQTGAKAGSRTFHLWCPPGQKLLYALGQLPADAAAWEETVPLPNPAEYFGECFKAALARKGIRLLGRVRTVDWLDRRLEPLAAARLLELGHVDSVPLREIVAEILKPSQNLYTDLLLAHLGSLCLATNAAHSELTSEQAGMEELNRFLAQAGVADGQVLFEEASGLSRNNLATPAAIVRLLEFMDRHRCAAEFRAALPVAGEDGTLRNRMRGTPAAGNVSAKTGTLRWANALSGYVTSAGGEPLAFALLLNRYDNRELQRSTRSELDALALLLAKFQGKSTE